MATKKSFEQAIIGKGTWLDRVANEYLRSREKAGTIHCKHQGRIGAGEHQAYRI